MTNFERVQNLWKRLIKKLNKKQLFQTIKLRTTLRLNLIKEELNELNLAIKKRFERSIDVLTDILYVTYGAGHAFGINLDKCFQEVQNSNMSKLGLDGKPIYDEKGKVMKGPKYFKPGI